MASSRRFEDLKDSLISMKEKIRILIRKNANEETIQMLFNEGDLVLDYLQAEVQRCPSSVQAEMTQNYNGVKNEWTAFKNTARRPALMGQSRYGYGTNRDIPTTTSAVLNEGITALQNTAASLRRSEIVARESEEIGTNIINELDGQRESLIRTRERLDATNNNLNRSHRVIRLINTHALTNKFLLIVIIFIEIAILISIIYLRFIHKHK